MKYDQISSFSQANEEFATQAHYWPGNRYSDSITLTGKAPSTPCLTGAVCNMHCIYAII